MVSLPKDVSAAIRAGDLSRLQQLFDDHPEYLKAPSPTLGGTWLHFASSYGHVGIMEYLIGLGFDVNAQDADGATPLASAAEGGHYKAVETLVHHGAVLRANTPRADPLFAAVSGSVHANASQPAPTGEAKRIVELLLRHGVDAQVRYCTQTLTDMDAVAFATMMGARELAQIIALHNANDDQLEASRALSQARTVAEYNTEPVPPDEDYRPS